MDDWIRSRSPDCSNTSFTCRYADWVSTHSDTLKFRLKGSTGRGTQDWMHNNKRTCSIGKSKFSKKLQCVCTMVSWSALCFLG